jgi:hypothetical protein
MTMPPCSYVLRIDGRATIRCIAEADETIGLCPVHRRPPTTAGGRSESQPSPPSSSPDAEALPWSDEDRAIFDVHAASSPKTRHQGQKRRRAG